MLHSPDYTKKMNGGAPQGWRPGILNYMNSPLQTEKNAAVYAIISTWNDADIIGANVRNCLSNGIDRVFILDNASEDQTVDVALNCGAELCERYETEFYDDDLRMKKQNEFIARTVQGEGKKDHWFVALDADEFVTGYDGMPYAEMLRRTPREIRVHCADAFDLYPMSPDEYQIGLHPASCMAMGMKRSMSRGAFWKCPAVRYFDGNCDISKSRGNHLIMCRRDRTRINAASRQTWMFHAPIRREAEARWRLEKLCGKSNEQSLARSSADDIATGNNGAIKRWHSLDNIFSHRWDLVEYPHSATYGRNVTGISLYPWRRVIPELREMQF